LILPRVGEPPALSGIARRGSRACFSGLSFEVPRGNDGGLLPGNAHFTGTGRGALFFGCFERGGSRRRDGGRSSLSAASARRFEQMP